MDNNQNIPRNYLSVMSTDLHKDLEAWYKGILEKESRYSYIVFTDNSYQTALIYEKITGLKMKDNHATFLTTSAFMLRINELAKYYERHLYFPSICIVDDVLMKSAEITHFLMCLEAEIKKELPNEDNDDVSMHLYRAISPYIYMKCDDAIHSLLLHMACELNMDYMRKESSNIFNSTLQQILLGKKVCNISNHNYLYTQYLSYKQLEYIKDKLLNDGFIYTSYWDKKSQQYSKHFYIDQDEKITAIISLRIMSCGLTDDCRITPFVFLPNLDELKTEELIKSITEIIPPQYVSLLEEWKQINGLQTLNEFIELVLSNIVLTDFNSKYKLEINLEDKENEIIKLARNYNSSNFEDTVTMLKDIIYCTENLTMDDLIHILKKIKCDVMPIPKNNEIGIDKNQKIRIQRRLENYFYKRVLEKEQRTIKSVRHMYTAQTYKKAIDARNCLNTISDLNVGYNKTEFLYSMAYFWHMIDVEYISLSSFAPPNIKVIGYSQFVYTEYNSVIIMLLRYYIYNQMLRRLQEKADYEGANVYNLLKEYAVNSGLNHVSECISIIRDMESMDQAVYDFTENYLRIVDDNCELYDGDISSFIRKLQKNGDDCQRFLKDKYKY